MQAFFKFQALQCSYISYSQTAGTIFEGTHINPGVTEANKFDFFSIYYNIVLYKHL